LASDTWAIFAPTSKPAPFGAGFLLLEPRRKKGATLATINNHHFYKKI
jgi:hypothetical protein